MLIDYSFAFQQHLTYPSIGGGYTNNGDETFVAFLRKKATARRCADKFGGDDVDDVAAHK